VIFSNADVIRRVNTDFVPVALKAGLVNNPPDNDEGRLYREIGRSKILPQGICVVNSMGKVLDWVFMFDDDKSVLAFLDHAEQRFADYPDAQKPFPTERYMKFPSQKLADIEDNGNVLPIVERHPKGESCPAKLRVQQGTIIARVFGRALDKDGKPVADTVRQENYVEDRFNVSVARQEGLAKALVVAGMQRFKIADDLASVLVSHAFMGELDVNPFGDVNGSKGQCTDCTFWGQKVQSDGNGPVRVHVDGKSEAAGVARNGQNGESPLWQHQVNLAWEGLIEMTGSRMTRLLLVARGTEKLTRRNKNEESGHLPGGHVAFIDLDCGVHFGIIGEPVPAAEAGSAQAATQDIPAEVRKHLAQTLGGSFLVFREKVQKDLKLTREQTEKLEQQLQEWMPDAMKFFEKIDGLKREEREKEIGAYRPKAQQKLAAVLKETMKEDQRHRLRQLELQQEGPFALHHGEVGIRKDLKITDEQRKQFMAVILEMQMKIAPLLKDVDSGGDPQEIWPKLVKIRMEHEARIEALLSDAQKKQWKEMLGKPLTLDD
jgi:hypothetical protein